jgi:DNA-binding XRE family transcriptional regulator
MQMMPNPPLDFTKVEALRKHMLLTTSDMASLFGVSRMTYYGWVRGKELRKSNDATVRVLLKRLLNIMVEEKWPTPDVIAMEQPQRKERLDELLKRFN